ncbi:hypothetical protein [Oceanidesulfovibrio marinus]|uniref:MJ0042 family finger-like domain-containing protein n=1 Tax=Oceanidesulfovibrio marinus TaxID=370038 RepID=A0A6P1ZFK1_9BACT|nr:hypothetical protein [Oceanidesulfovibrio marinus]QJT08590.1 hypothetical protein E8L03_06485 [Oceanidesulfovibrio marinus]TVM32576.1 hypothetical protein DQK91_14985 [Oceanidesulfovibrio marinus]
MHVICTACLKRLFIAPEKMPAGESTFPMVCPRCGTPLLVDPQHGRTFATGATAYAAMKADAALGSSELDDILAALERMTVKVRTGLRRTWPEEQDTGLASVFDVEDND